MTYDYARHPYGDWDNLRILPLLPALEFTQLSSKTSEPEGDIQLGAPRTLTARSAIRLPEGFRTDLPDPIHVKTDFANFDKTYRFENGEVITDRTVVVLKRKVPKTEWKKYQEFTKSINLENDMWIQLLHTAKPVVTTGKAESKGTEIKTETNTVQAQPVTALMAQAIESVRNREWEHARELLKKVEQMDPKARGLWAELGFIAETDDHNLDQSKANYRKELANEPDNEWTVNALSRLEANTGHSGEARRIVQKYVDQHPENSRMAFYLASMQMTAGDDQGALKTLEAVSTQHPGNRMIPVQMGAVLIRLNRKQEAAAAARSAMEGSDDPEILNNAAYVLSESGVDLALAEEASRKSIAKLELESADITTAQANSKAFARANLLIAAWDTLGWTLELEGKSEQAEPILSAAWRASLRAEIGDHLAQLYEAADQKQRAYELYVLAQAAADKNTPPDTKTHVAEGVARLRPEGAKPSLRPNPEGLQALRTYKIKMPASTKGWGSFRLEITADGVIESQQMSGEHTLDQLKPAINGMKFPELLPPGSKAHLLRSAVVSCSMGSNCEVVLVPDGGLQIEQE
jgi:tetratricopeptide (TPR) repeat protein